ncbi:MAG: SUF system Fe-S cluster assembly protein [Lentimicrobium sp.]|nr:SUF system Fe-S cluster assembly protein [Lentimicrobium sp.]MDD2529149.1 SUF system Fe-S cluster assembly protein [Lentimicrobiaceae bacterium]MDD4599181.1 SUF system Fe-S cluster assembly protein [Lentimicrobiaceae bacterium]MDY0026066.1 SUF system Fe-S cluster assembly protein [Lentimicrobium sp.]HAH58377.1 SUF system Fe-S cluster assembly protein [Bacteroidales bacterium]
MNHEKTLELGNKIIDRLKTIFDPEIPVNIYDLGLIYKIDVDEHSKAHILMTLTTPNCPVAESLPAEVKQKIQAIDGVSGCEIELTFDPPWDQDMISEAAMLDLGLL